VGEIDEDAASIEFPDDLPPEVCEPGVSGFEAAISQEIRSHICELDDAHAEPREDLDEAEIALDRRGVLESVDDPDASLALRRFDFGHRADGPEDIGVLLQPVVECPDLLDGPTEVEPVGQGDRVVGRSDAASPHMLEVLAHGQGHVEGIDYD
jgi:hypothetical protein